MPAQLRRPTLAYAASRALDTVGILCRPGGTTKVIECPAGQLVMGDGECCESSRRPARGVRGRAATLVDAFGLICDEP